ncbi:probable protein arginine N-methyltransferase 6.1 [Pogonomyrmex barbatus]|uniref:type I protein arginine methyltransferase n=1 Tax=Pogonomyrmex barbatus TaxID=144034 RepID=A0A6I9WQH1_9HYME|nr:probable protein arginine N-methyltransferase 6.1 [Pogonomyrmex barbatus]XP_011644304.1 probable protein arginine N-methyltransferase 6.1 [Pogonomyrmex barbatus]
MDQYFKSYEELDIHQLMLSDKARVLAYKTAIFNSKEKFQNKIVMDIGAGSGILSIFCAQVGAKKVYAVEASELAKNIEQVTTENNVQDKIEVIHSKIEDIDPNNLEKVDIIVSEWMGFYLVHEGMLDSILFARDYFLREDGLLFPWIAKLYASPCQLPSMYEFWNDICGVSMRCIGQEYRKIKSLKPQILLLNQNDLLGDIRLLAWLDLSCISMKDIDLLGEENHISVCKKDGRFQGMCIWFAIEFPDGSELSTGPYDKETHWKQTVIVLPEDIEVIRNEPIVFKLELKKDMSYPRRYNMELSLLDVEKVEHDVPCSCHMTKCIVTKKYIENLEIESHIAGNTDL